MTHSPKRTAEPPAGRIVTDASTPREPWNAYHTPTAIHAVDEPYRLSLFIVRSIVYLQLFVEIFWLIFTHLPLWAHINGFIVPCIGLYATRNSMNRARRKWISMYYYGNIFVFVLAVLYVCTFLIVLWKYPWDRATEVYIFMMIASMTLYSILYCFAARKTKQFRTQFDQCVPPTNPIVFVTTV